MNDQWIYLNLFTIFKCIWRLKGKTDNITDAINGKITFKSFYISEMFKK